MTEYPGIVLDDARQSRIGFDEAILCAQKTPAQIAEIIRMSSANGQTRFFTRLSEDKLNLLPAEEQGLLSYAPDAQSACLGEQAKPSPTTRIAIVSGGSSDAPVVAEARETLRYYGQHSLVIPDVGVAGLWRLMNRIDDIAKMPVVIAIAGMDAALPTVLTGLVPSSVIGVPTSTGYGAAKNGETALFALLSSCAPGLTVTNIDNGYGAAAAALRIIYTVEKEAKA